MCSVARIGEAGFDIGDTGEVECHYQFWNYNVELRNRLYAASTLEGCSAEIRAIRKVENGVGVVKLLRGVVEDICCEGLWVDCMVGEGRKSPSC